MKATKLLNFFLICLSVGFIACSSDDDVIEPVEPVVNSITLTPSSSTINIGDAVTFIVTSDSGQEITANANILVDGESIEGDTFNPMAPGVFSAKATYKDIESEIVEITVNQGANPLNLLVNAMEIDVTEDFIFKVVDENGDEVTNSIIYIDGESINDNMLETPAEGTYQAHATIENEEGMVVKSSAVLTLEVIDRAVFTQNVLIEDYTGTWCGWCPRVAYGIELVEEQTDKAVVVAIHRGNANPNGEAYDPFNYPASTLENLIGLQGYPTAMLNRTTLWNYPEPSNTAQAVNLTGEDAGLGVKINPTLEGNTMNINIDVKFGEDYSTENLKLVVYVMEDGLILDQVNYTSYYGGNGQVTIIHDFTHNNVLREVLTGIMGDPIPLNESSAGSIYSKNYNMPVPGNVSDNSNIEIVAFVTDGDNNAVLNSRSAVINETQLF